MANVKKISKDKWRADIQVDGQRMRPSFDTKASAESFLVEVKREHTMRRLGITSAQHEASCAIADAIRKYVKDVTAHKHSSGAMTAEKTVFGKFYEYMGNTLGVDFVEDVTTLHIRGFQESLETGISPASVNRQMTIIRHFFTKCVEWGYIKESPALQVKKLKEAAPEIAVFTEDEAELLMTCGRPEMRGLYRFLYETGARPVEACKLVWSDVNLREQTVRLHCWKNSKNGVRIIPISHELRAELSRHKLATGGRFIFTNVPGRAMRPDYACSVFAKDRRDLGLRKGLKLYSLRHKFATDLVAQNVNSFTIQKLMGHAKIETTQKYVHVQMNEMRAAVEGLRKETFHKADTSIG